MNTRAKRNVTKNINAEGRRLSMDVTSANPNLSNALRRALMLDVKRYSPADVTIYENTSSQTDEYIAHRIGLMPFLDCSSEHTEENSDIVLTLSVHGRSPTTDDLKGTRFRCAECIPIVLMSDEQTLRMEIRMALNSGATHARYSHIGPVSYNPMSTGVVRLSFETLCGDPICYALDAVRSLLSRIDDAILFVEKEYDRAHIVCHTIES